MTTMKIGDRVKTNDGATGRVVREFVYDEYPSTLFVVRLDAPNKFGEKLETAENNDLEKLES